MRTKLRNARRLVVKVGSALVTNNGAGLDKDALDAWARTRLDDGARARLDAARAEAVETLRETLASPTPGWARALGMPSPTHTRSLFHTLEEALWAA